MDLTLKQCNHIFISSHKALPAEPWQLQQSLLLIRECITMSTYTIVMHIEYKQLNIPVGNEKHFMNVFQLLQYSVHCVLW